MLTSNFGLFRLGPSATDSTSWRLWALVSVLRLAAALVAFLLGFIGEPTNVGFLTPWEVGIPVLAYAVIVPLAQVRAGRNFPSLNASIADCVVGLTAVALNGGWQSPYFLLLVSAIVAATLVLPAPESLLISAAICAVYGVVAIIVGSGGDSGIRFDVSTDNLAILFATALVTSTLNYQWRIEAQHLRQEQQLARRLSMLNRMMVETFLVSLDRGSAMRTIALLTREAMGTDVAGVVLRAGEGWRLWSDNVGPEGIVLGEFPDIRSDGAASVSFVAAVAQTPFRDPFFTVLGADNLALAPIAGSPDASGVAGAVFVGHSDELDLPEDDQHFLAAIVRHVEFANRNADIYALEREQVRSLKEVERLKTDFFNNVSHDLLTPLGAVKTATGLLESDEESRLSPLSATLLKNIARNTDRLQSMVQDLLEISRIQSGRVRLSRSWVTPDAVAADAAEVVAPLIRAKSLNLQRAFTEPLPLVWVDRNRLARVMVNLLENATKYTPEGGTIEFAIDKADGVVQFQVSDSGPGIPPEDRDRVFERFYRTEGGEDRSGVGLGLFVARTLVELHGGAIRVESEEGHGATFVVTVPLGEDDEDSDC